MSRFLGFAAAFFILIGCTGTVDQPIGEAVRPITHNSQFELALSAGIGTIRHAPVAAVAPGVDHATAQGLVHDCQSLDAELADPGDIGAASDLALAGAHCLGFIRGLTQANARSQTIAHWSCEANRNITLEHYRQIFLVYMDQHPDELVLEAVVPMERAFVQAVGCDGPGQDGPGHDGSEHGKNVAARPGPMPQDRALSLEGGEPDPQSGPDTWSVHGLQTF